MAAGSSSEDSATGTKSKLPDVTKWTSPKEVRNLPSGATRGGGYRGDAYRGFGNRGYSGVTRGYRGDGAKNMRTYRGDGKSSSYRGYKSPADNYRGYRR